ncbi:acyl-CoA dehydrogenase family protein [Sinosporangium siamense]|uniref:Acyl-CoA dehydrogenase FadE n=1 Tax=Sinosporangium siamense TaxID=1367973 RepID=A0A919R9D3_9ACTN|nr:acyl-CoA dehydrogenase family protein [Sinosporangium siamense]GII89800.1 putative acyl-CoA dehydrogenase FadE [Sinosporangium siamense]
MTFLLSDHQLAFAASVREVLEARCPASAVRAAGEGGERLPGWAHLAKLGFFGMLVATEQGGLGLRLIDAVPALEETGRAALPGPVVETAVAAAGVLGGDRAAALADGSLRVSARLGDQTYLPDADLADLLVVQHAGALHVLRPDEVRLMPQPAIDPVRRLFAVRLDGALRTRGSPAGTAAGRVTVAVSAQLIGLARHLLDATGIYAGTRTHTDGPLGSRQDAERALAGVAMAIEIAAPTVHRAAVALDTAAPTADRDVSAAKAAAGEAAERAARTALRVHGASGYSRELDLRLWLTRVWALSSAYGGTELHRARLRAAVLGSPELRRRL